MADKKFYLFVWGLLIFSILAWGVFATFDILSDSGNAEFDFTEDTEEVYRLQVNASLTADFENITQVNITIPTNCSFNNLGVKNITSAIVTNFSNTSDTLTWVNSSGGYIVAGGDQNINASFQFNMTCNYPGRYNVSVYLLNQTAVNTINETNISLLINDTTGPTITLLNGNNLTYLNATNVSMNITVTDYDANSTNSLCRYSFDDGVNNISMSNETHLISAAPHNATNSSVGDGWYNITFWCNDTAGNDGTIVKNMTVDTTNPTVPSFSCSPATLVVGYATTCSCSGATDATSGLNTTYGHTYTQKPSTLVPGTFTLTCKVKDLTSNKNSVTTTYTVSGTSDPLPSGGTVYSNTILEDEEEFDEIGSITKEVEDKTQIRIKINDEEHNIGITEVSETSVTIEIPGTGETTSMNIGDIKKFDVTGDGFYDVSVTLNSIEADKADVTMSYIHEEVPAVTEEEKVSGLTEKVGGLPIWLWIVIGVVVIIVLVALGIKAKKK